MPVHSPRFGLPLRVDPPLRRALALDLDGVLLDTRPVMQQAWQKVRESHGVDTPFEAYEQHLGRPFPDIMELLGLAGTGGVQETYAAAAQSASWMAKPFGGVEEVLHAFAAAGWLLAVVTSKSLDRAAPLLARLGTPFSTVRTPGGVGRGKPAPDTLLLALVDMGIDPACATYVGDMAVDQECAQRAGVPYVHAAWGYGFPDRAPQLIAEAPGDLLRLLEAHGDSAPFVEGSLV